MALFSFYFDQNLSSGIGKREFENSTSCSGQFSDLKGFHSLWKSSVEADFPIVVSSQLSPSVRVFRSEVSPLWEDEANKNGGKWVLSVRPQHRVNFAKLVDGMIQGSLPHCQDIVGAVISIRGNTTKVSLWNRSADKQDVIDDVAEALKGFFEGPKIQYLEHKPHLKKLHATAQRRRSKEVGTPPTGGGNRRSGSHGTSVSPTSRRSRDLEAGPASGPGAGSFRSAGRFEAIRGAQQLSASDIAKALESVSPRGNRSKDSVARRAVGGRGGGSGSGARSSTGSTGGSSRTKKQVRYSTEVQTAPVSPADSPPQSPRGRPISVGEADLFPGIVLSRAESLPGPLPGPPGDEM